VLTAGGAAGQLVFLPLVASVTETAGWRVASLGVSAAALAVAPLVVWLLRDRPSAIGAAPYGGTPADEPPALRTGAARVAIQALVDAARTRPFWYLAGGMAICGATTVGLIQPHFVPAAHDHGLPITVGAGLLALVGIFDIAGTIGSGWLTDRVDPRLLLLVYYVLRGLSLMGLPLLLGPSVHPTLLLFVVFYGLDWVATIPPTMALAREHFGARAPIVFGWVFASHQVGAAAMALVAGIIRDRLHTYDAAWYVGGALCLVAGVLSLAVGRTRRKAGLPA
jgi:predicted MFS family arabinose efflux permease